MEPQEQFTGITDRLKRIQGQLSASDYTDQIYETFSAQAKAWFTPAKLTALDRLYSILEKDYKRIGLVGHGYHCLEHSVESALLALLAPMDVSINSSKSRLEMAVAALLHDYDPLRRSGPPDLERTIKVVRIDRFFGHIFDELQLDPIKVALLIERTDHPITSEKIQIWKYRLADYMQSPEEAAGYAVKGDMLSRLTKASTYVCLSPQKIIQRVEELADELNIPREAMLARTYNFLLEERISETAAILPKPYQYRWELAERYFLIVSETETVPQK